MSALGQKQTSEGVKTMSALPPKADIGTHSSDVRFVPKADMKSAWRARPPTLSGRFLVALRRPLQSLKDLVEIETLRLLSRRILLERVDECRGNRLCAVHQVALVNCPRKILVRCNLRAFIRVHA